MSDALINDLAGAGGGIIAQLLIYPLHTVRGWRRLVADLRPGFLGCWNFEVFVGVGERAVADGARPLEAGVQGRRRSPVVPGPHPSSFPFLVWIFWVILPDPCRWFSLNFCVTVRCLLLLLPSIPEQGRDKGPWAIQERAGRWVSGRSSLSLSRRFCLITFEWFCLITFGM